MEKPKLGKLNLEFRDGNWHATLYTPERLKAAMSGQRVQRQNLHTADKQAAIRASGPVIAQFRRNLELAAERAAEAVSPKQAAWLDKQAQMQRAKVAKLQRQLDQARELAEWVEGQNGIAPVIQAPQEKAVTFADAAKQCIAAKRPEWKKDAWSPSLRLHVLPYLGHLPIGDVTTDDVTAVLKPLWLSRSDTGVKTRQRIEAIWDYGKARGWCSGDNPARFDGLLEHLLPSRRKLAPTVHHSSLPWRDVPRFVAAIRREDRTNARALEFLILTACRGGEVRGATWPEIDLAEKLWTIPASRMKGGRVHTVPLSDRAVAILQEMQGKRLRRHGEWCFPGRLRALSHDTFTGLMDQYGGGAAVHGLRSSFRDWCADNGKDSELAEWSLAHVTGSGAERAYRRSDALDRRRTLMAEWAAYCGG